MSTAAETEPLLSWQDSLSELSTLLSSSADNNNKATISTIEKSCHALLTNTNDDTPPQSATDVIRTIYLRSLIKLNKYQAAIDYIINTYEDFDNSNAEELAYSFYRLKKYDDCRKVCYINLTNESDGPLVNYHNKDSDNYVGDLKSRGLKCIYAQTLYRLGETSQADTIYQELLLNDNNNLVMMDVDEQEDLLSNALANKISNYTYKGTSSVANSSGGSEYEKPSTWLEDNEILQQLLTSYGQSNTNNNNSDLLQNYDLAYNLATYLLLSKVERPTSNILIAKSLLEHAEKSALTIFQPSSTEDASTPEEEKVNEEVKRQQQLVAQREANPIQANLALSKLLLGGTTNENDAMRTYLTLVTKFAMAKKTKGGSKAGSAGEGNLMAISSNNLAVLRDGKESVFDVVKRIPTTSSLSVSDDNITSGKGGKDKSYTSSTVPLVGATPQQVRVALYNRAVLYIKMKNVTGCLDTLRVLRSSLHVSYHGDNKVDTKKADPQSPKKSKGKKKKGAAAAGDNVVPTAKPASDAEILAWEARADLLESELYRISESKDKSYEDILNGAIDKLDKALLKDDTTSTGVLEFTKAQLLLHKAMVNNSSSSKDVQPLIDAIDSLPSSIKSCPGVIATLASLHSSLNKESSSEELLSSLGDTIPAKLAMAEYKMDQGQYDEAVELLQGIVDEGSGGIEATALLVKALSYTDPTKAEEYVEELQLAMEGVVGGGSGDFMDGEVLESMDIPRFAKKELSSASSGSSTKVRKMIAATGGKGRSNMG